MDHAIPHILIAEREFLIALDAEYKIKSSLACRTTLLRPEQLDGWDSSALAHVDLCLLDVPFDPSNVLQRIKRLIDEGVPLLLTSVCEIHQDGVEGFEAIPLVTKPFDDDSLLEQVRARLRPQAQPVRETDQN